MPKERRMKSLSLQRSRASPYQRNSQNIERRQANENPSTSCEGAKEWDDIRCPICVEPPHNAVLLCCSSCEKGCKPYVCDTSVRLSNCFDQLCKSSVRPNEILDPNQALYGRRTSESKLLCPLCRGEVYGYLKGKDAREFMDAKVRSCSHESCNFSGTYSDLRKHTRVQHPGVSPREVDPERQFAWERTEQEAYMQDLLDMVEFERQEEEINEFDDHILNTMDGVMGEDDEGQIVDEYEGEEVRDFQGFMFDCVFFDAYMSLEASVQMWDRENPGGDVQARQNRTMPSMEVVVETGDDNRAQSRSPSVEIVDGLGDEMQVIRQSRASFWQNDGPNFGSRAPNRGSQSRHPSIEAVDGSRRMFWNNTPRVGWPPMSGNYNPTVRSRTAMSGRNSPTDGWSRIMPGRNHPGGGRRPTFERR